MCAQAHDGVCLLISNWQQGAATYIGRRVVYTLHLVRSDVRNGFGQVRRLRDHGGACRVQFGVEHLEHVWDASDGTVHPRKKFAFS